MLSAFPAAARKPRLSTLHPPNPDSNYPFIRRKPLLLFIAFCTCSAGLFIALLSLLDRAGQLQGTPHNDNYLQTLQNSALHIKQERLNPESTSTDATEAIRKPTDQRRRKLSAVIRDVVLLLDDVLLLIDLRQSNNTNHRNYGRNDSRSTDKDDVVEESNLLRRAMKARSLACFFHAENISTQVSGVDFKHGGRCAMVRCRIPGAYMNLTADSDELKLRAAANVSLQITNMNSNRDKSLSFDRRQQKQHGWTPPEVIGPPLSPLTAKHWGEIVFEIWHTEEDVVLFAKGINNRQGKDVSPAELACVYGDGEGRRVRTVVKESAQEVFRCEHPAPELRSRLRGAPLTLIWGQKELASIVYYAGDAIEEEEEREEKHSGTGGICVCTMVYNVAKFVKEWAIYHAHTGVDLFIVYDNGSYDRLDRALRLAGARSQRRPWPWPKTQEAGLSHCALAMRRSCEWAAFIDVDEFLYLPKGGGSSALRRLTAAAEPGVGQISIRCRDFGPSGLNQTPAEGVTQGYTCRLSREERHKSVVRLTAVSNGLKNVVHHFDLSPEFATENVKTTTVVVNHYKYQAWTEFRQKFRRRVSAYVADWGEDRNLDSKDRTPGLGRLPIKPDKWEHSFCDVQDTALRDYVRATFSTNNTFPWVG